MRAIRRALAGFYVTRTSVDKDRLGTGEAVGGYGQLSKVGRVFRSIKTADLKIKPIHHRLERARMLLCMLAY